MRNDLFTTRRQVPIIRDNNPKLQTAIANGQGDYARIFVMINNVFIGHAGLIIGEGEDALLYDPAGNYEGCEEVSCRGSIQSFRGSGDFFEYPQFDWDSYLKYHLEDGDDIVIFEFIVPRSQMERMKDIVFFESETADNFYCASNVARVLPESGGVFNNIPDEFFAPWGLKKHLLNIQSQKGVVPHVFITMPPHRPFQ